jgi:hypothetical protein
MQSVMIATLTRIALAAVGTFKYNVLSSKLPAATQAALCMSVLK